MNIMKKIITSTALAMMAYILIIPAASAAEMSEKALTGSVNTIRHYDPSHIGHSHQCNSCRRSYNQQGDNGAYSPGSNVCPYCGYSNPIPPSGPSTQNYTGMTWTTGRDGVKVYYPSNGWTWTEGRDGRRVIYPSNGWTWTEGRDGKRVVYPVNGWTWAEGRDGHRVVYPVNGWSRVERSDGRISPYPYNGNSSQDYAYFIVSLLSREVRLSPELESYRDMILREMKIIEY